jgi:vitamin B12 transporter
MKKIVIGVWLLSVLFLSAGAQAQEAQVQLKEVLVTADRIETSIGETTSDVVVIKGEDIKKANSEFVADALRQVSDINIVQNGGAGQTSTVFLRGGDSTKVLVMIDGVKVKSTTFGAFDFSGLRVGDIERIEIVKGPQSTLYGSEAMAGVINVVTKKGRGRASVEASLEAGSFETIKSSIALSGGDEKTDYRLAASTFETAGISAASAGTERDGYRDGSLSGRFGFKPSDKVEFDLSGNYHHDRAELDGFDFAANKAVDDLNYVQYGDHTILSARGKAYLSSSWEQVMTISRVRDALRSRDPDTAYNNVTIKTGMDAIDWQHNLFFTDQYTLTVGAETRKELGEISGSFDRYLHNRAGYLNNRLKLARDRLILNAGLRYDDHEIAGTKATHRLGALYDFTDTGLKIKGNYGTGFRVPSFNELFYPGYGSPDLLPETSTAWDLGLEKTMLQKRIIASVTYFDQEYRNLIESDPSTWLAVNIARAEVKGIETEIGGKAADEVTIKAGHTYLDARDKDTGSRLTRRPVNKSTLTMIYAAERMSFVVNYAFVGQRYDSSVQRNLASYNLVNVSSTYALSKGLSLFARIDNLFNTKYEEAGSYGTPGLSAYGGIKVTLL